MGDGILSSVLLDTHVWIWAQLEPERLGPATKSLLLKPESQLHVATISTLELARLAKFGHVELGLPVGKWIERAIELLGAESLPLTHDIAVESYSLPEPFHRDPADRILVATARKHALQLVTADERILQYPHVATLEALR